MPVPDAATLSRRLLARAPARSGSSASPASMPRSASTTCAPDASASRYRDSIVARSISPAANVFPRLMVRMIEHLERGEVQAAREISDVFAPLRAAWAWGSFPVVIKEAMALVGRSAGPARAPIQPLPEPVRAKLKSVVNAILAASSRLAH